MQMVLVMDVLSLQIYFVQNVSSICLFPVKSRYGEFPIVLFVLYYAITHL